ncbi:MAG: NADH-quinone oxidoreductase subunit A [Candidatus Acidiferrales bacterium]
MPAEYIPLLIFAAIVAAVPAIGFGLARRAGRSEPFLSGESNTAREPLAFEETERRSNSSLIFLIGALFVICDAAIIFLIPWAVRIGELGAFGLIAIAGFFGALACGYVWLYRNRALERL